MLDHIQSLRHETFKFNCDKSMYNTRERERGREREREREREGGRGKQRERERKREKEREREEADPDLQAKHSNLMAIILRTGHNKKPQLEF